MDIKRIAMALVIMLGMNAQVNAQVKDVHSKAYEAEKVNGDWLAWLGARTISSNGTTVYYTGGVEIEKYFVPDGQPLEQEDGCKQAMQQATRYLANVIRSNKGLWEGLEAYKDRAYKIKMLDVTIAELLVRAGKKVDPKDNPIPQKEIANLKERCSNVSQDLKDAIEAHKKQDAQKAADKAAYEAAQKREVEKKQAAEAAQQAAKAAASTRKKTPADTKEEQQIKSKNYLLDNLEDQYKPERMTDRARVILCVRGAVSEVLGANRHEKTVTTSAKWMPVQLTTPQLKKYGKAEKMTCKSFYTKDGKTYVVHQSSDGRWKFPQQKFPSHSKTRQNKEGASQRSVLFNFIRKHRFHYLESESLL